MTSASCAHGVDDRIRSVSAAVNSSSVLPQNCGPPRGLRALLVDEPHTSRAAECMCAMSEDTEQRACDVQRVAPGHRSREAIESGDVERRPVVQPQVEVRSCRVVTARPAAAECDRNNARYVEETVGQLVQSAIIYRHPPILAGQRPRPFQ